VVWQLSELNWANSLLALPLLYVVYDFFYTLFHRALHHRSLYRHIHKHHHRQVIRSHTGRQGPWV
jgi:sterol desaturase/sphingolipid hydroxylase (fatty acid hydroxylase superfamily)